MNALREFRPTDQTACSIAKDYLQHGQFAISRFNTGSCHYVYEISPSNQAPFVLRIGHEETRANLMGSVYWSERISPLGLPIAKILYKDLGGPYPYTILNRIPGTDLGDVYHLLTPTHKKDLAQEIAHWQLEVGKICFGKGFGFGFSESDPRLKKNWTDVIYQQLARARTWIEAGGIYSHHKVDRVQSMARRLESYFQTVLPIPFLHDTTTKNVLIHDCKLSGIVDIDDLCFGDPLFVVALINMALLAGSKETDYVAFLCEALKVTQAQHNALNFYTALFCVTFMGEMGQKFNRDSVTVDMQQVGHLERVLDGLCGGHFS